MTNITKEVENTKFGFENPMHLPLEKLYIPIINSEGRVEQIKALNKFWITERYYPHYFPLPETMDELDKWIERSTNYINALKYILRLPFHKFWSYILYEPKVSKMLDSFLQNAVPCYLPQPSGPFEEPYTEIYNLIFEIYNKIFTPDLSKTEFIDPTTLGALLRENKVITNYTLWDLSRLYGHIDDGTLGHLLVFAYEIIPNLKEELELTVHCMCEIFEAIGTAAYENDSPTESAVNNLTKLLYDTAFSINMFLKTYVPFKNVCISHSLPSRIIHTYDSEIPILYHLMKQVYINDNHSDFDVVDNARVELLETCHNLLSYCMDMILQTQENSSQKQDWTDKYLSLITSIIESNGFLTDYNKVYPISQDMDMLTAICPNIDERKCQLILETVKKHEVQEEKEEQKAQELQNGFKEMNLQDEATTSSSGVPEDVVLESQITELMEMFPNYGDGFIEQCLIHMNQNSQAVIIAILEEKLSPQLAELDRTLPRIPPEVPEPGPSVKEAYVGKKPSEHKNFTELLNDKSHVREQRSRFELYSSTTEDNLYDDDYDDRYDEDYAVGVDIDDKEEILKPRRRGAVESEEEEEQDETENNGQQSRVNGDNKPRDQFCEDPAVIRARREQRYQQQRGRGRGGGQTNSRPKDVVGNAKGQGQEKDVLRAREKKNVNKSARGNHNRRAGAQFKRNRGMIPS